MTSKERREKGMLFIADDADWVQMKRARQLTQRLNTVDRSDFDAIRAIINELFGKSDETTFAAVPFSSLLSSHAVLCFSSISSHAFLSTPAA